MNRNLVRLFLVLLPFVPLASAADSGRGQPPLLVVQINGGKVALTTRNSGLGEGELNVLRTLLEERVREMPGWESGRLTLRLRERALEKLQPKLQEAARGELRNPDLLTELIEDEVDFEYDPEGEADSPDQTRVFIGRDFHLGPDTALEQVVAIGSRGVVEGDVEELVAIGSDIRLGPSARVAEKPWWP